MSEVTETVEEVEVVQETLPGQAPVEEMYDYGRVMTPNGPGAIVATIPASKDKPQGYLVAHFRGSYSDEDWASAFPKAAKSVGYVVQAYTEEEVEETEEEIESPFQIVYPEVGTLWVSNRAKHLFEVKTYRPDGKIKLIWKYGEYGYQRDITLKALTRYTPATPEFVDELKAAHDARVAEARQNGASTEETEASDDTDEGDDE